ncbi:pyruvate kinase [Candidatus Gracilibacteria bacterium]|nr:pyruvate kinase [Candidatus Gracilibacteria bacterium]OIO75620.1 MAG: pyruvate kinase [Candidatus Gracilibacteria bacterium CG1_02_38_174]
MKKTKIIATVGPVTESEEQLIALYKAGVNIIRFNFSHANYEVARAIMGRIRKLNSEGKTNLSTLLDTKGPEIRTGDLKSKIQFEKGDVIKIYTDISKFSNDSMSLFCDYISLVEDVNIGQIIRIDSGLFDVEVVEKTSDYIRVIALNSCLIGSRRHVNLPGVKLRLPGITGQDKKDVLFSIEEGYDFIAMSFVRNCSNVEELRNLLSEHNASHIKIISKIENQEGIENLDEIIEASDGVMVARGDLGIEVPIEKLPVYQLEIVKKSMTQGKFVIVATHLLETMIENPFPTRAEVSDIFNCVRQCTDCTMLSGETTIGKYPIKTVEMMTAVINEAEANMIYEHKDFSDEGLCTRDIEKKHLIKNALITSESINARVVLIFTKSGRLARFAAAFRPNKDVYAFTMNESSVRYMNALFGIRPMLLGNWTPNLGENLDNAIALLKEKNILSVGDRVIAVNDIQKEGKEIPVMEIITIE